MREKNITYYPDKEDFLKLDKNINILTVYRKILADTETPISAFQKIGRNGLSYLLESAVGGDKLARYSFIGVDPFLLFQSKDKRIEVKTKGKKEVYTENPLLYLRRLFAEFRTSPIKGLPRFFGGGVGYFGYDLVRFIEELPRNTIDDLDMPDCILIFAGIVLVFDHLTHQMWIIANIPLEKSGLSKDAAYTQAITQIEKILSQLKNQDHPSLDKHKEIVRKREELSPTRSNITQKDYVDKVKKAKEYILAGDAFQVVLSQRLSRKTKEKPFKVYRSLRSLNPSPYMYYLNYGKVQVVGASPEPLVRLTGELVESKPIAGTRHRGKNEVEDIKLEKEMLNDEKEKAEHTMLVDLARNDLGRICRPGTVKVSHFMKVEKFSHVMHLVSEVEGKIQSNKNAFDALEACFPAGTVSGAPKVRAMEIIDELEPNYRGPYAGAVGYIGFNGNMDTCITIRTLIFKGDQAYIQVGAGIVDDSVPELEHKETLNKSKAMFKAIDLAESF
jgi:anthranilate synthase component 1